MTLPAETTLTVWVCLLPHLSPEVEAGSICRQLVGGVKVGVRVRVRVRVRVKVRVRVRMRVWVRVWARAWVRLG